MSVVRIKISSDTITETVVFPTWSGEILQERADDEVYFRSTLGGDFQFIGDEYRILKDNPDCERIEIWLEEKCGSDWVEQWRGYFTTYDIRFDDNKCVAVVRPELVDDYECFLAVIQEDINFSAVEEQEVRSVRGKYQAGAQCCTDLVLIAEPTPSDPVCAVPAGYCFDKNTRTELWTPGHDLITSCFHRIRGIGTATDPPPYASGWTFLVEHFGQYYWWRCPVAGEIELGKLSHGKRFGDVLDYLALQAGCDFSVRSHFFANRNTHADPPDNAAYDYAETYLQNLTIHQKSDVKCPDCSNEAESIVWKMTWEKFLSDLKTMFNVYWIITPENDFILEHISYFEATAGLDVSAQNIVLNYGKGEVSAPNKEVFKWADDATFSAAHAGQPITYGDCGHGVKTNRVELFSNDVFYIRQVENQSDISDVGYCLVSNVIEDDVYYIQDYNNPLGWEMLHDNLHRHYRYFGQGQMNGIDDTFITVRKTRKLREFSTNVCCDDDFDPTDYITTAAGEIDVQKATVNYFSGKENRVLTIEATI